MLSSLKRLFAKHRLAYLWGRRARILIRHAARKPHEPDFAAFSHFPGRTGLFLDIGANAGQSALSFRLFNRDSPILSIEPNRSHEPDLRLLKRVLRGFDYMICAAGEHNGECTLYVPVYDGVPLTGDASLLRETAMSSWWVTRQGADPERLGVEAVPVPIRRLDDLGLAPSFIKIDVEGFELSVVRGLTETMREHEPVLLVECADENDELRELLATLGYEPFAYDRDTDVLQEYLGQRVLNLVYLPPKDTRRCGRPNQGGRRGRRFARARLSAPAGTSARRLAA